MGSSMSHPVSIAAVPVGLAAAFAAKDDYRSRPCSVPPEFLDVLNEKVEIRKSKSPIITAELERIFNEMHQMKDIFTWRIPTNLVLMFVGEVETAHQYFDLKKYMREEFSSIMHDNNQEYIFDCIVTGDKKHNRFNKVSEEAIKTAVEDYISELKEEHIVHMKFDLMKYLKSCESINWNSNFNLILESHNIIEKYLESHNLILESHDIYEIKHGFERCIYEYGLFGSKDDEVSYQYRLEIDCKSELHLLRQKKMKDVDIYAAVNKVFALVFQKREEGCALDQNPVVEVAKLIMSMSEVNYRHFFLVDGPMENLLHQARTVIVRNVPLNASELDVKELFMLFGGIEHVAMKSGDKYQTAYVTFEYPEGVDEPLLLQRPAVLGLPVCMRPMLGSEQRQAVSAHVRSQEAKTQEAKTRKAEDGRELEEALMKYAALNRRYFPNQ